MRLALLHNQLEIAIEDDEKNGTKAYVKITTEGTVTVQDSAGETRVITLNEDLTLD